MKTFNIKFNAATSVGGREMNQDVFLANNVVSDADTIKDQYFEDVCSCSNGDIRVFAVCDGIGSYKNSGFAAHTALSKIQNLIVEYNTFLKNEQIGLDAWVLYALDEARSAMLDFCRRNNYNGASSTIAMLVLRDGEYVFANIGDSPCYARTAEGEFKELSLKHNLATYKRRKNIDCSENDERVLLYHLGDKSREIMLTTHMVSGRINSKDAFFVCSDGVAATLGEGAVNNMLAEQQTSDKFVAKAAECPGADNCTAITIYIENADSGDVVG